jgi:hypothetical protein
VSENDGFNLQYDFRHPAFKRQSIFGLKLVGSHPVRFISDSMLASGALEKVWLSGNLSDLLGVLWIG